MSEMKISVPTNAHPCAYDAIYDRFGVAPEWRSPEHYFFDIDQEGHHFPVPREQEINGAVYNLDEHGTLISPEAELVGADIHIGGRTMVMAHAGLIGTITVGRDCVIEGGTQIISETTIQDNVTVMAGSHITNSTLEKGAMIGRRSGVYNSTVGAGTSIGHNSSVSESNIAGDAVIGNTVSIARCQIGEGVHFENHTDATRSVVGEESRVLEGAAIPTGKNLRARTIVIPKGYRARRSAPIA